MAQLELDIGHGLNFDGNSIKLLFLNIIEILSDEVNASEHTWEFKLWWDDGVGGTLPAYAFLEVYMDGIRLGKVAPDSFDGNL